MNETTAPASRATPPPPWRRPIFWIAVVVWIPVVAGIGWTQWWRFRHARERREEKQRLVLEAMRLRVLENAPSTKLDAPAPPLLAFQVMESSLRRSVKRLVGVEGPREYARAIMELRVDAQLGSADAMALLGDALLSGDPETNVPPDLAEAHIWIERARRAGSPLAADAAAHLAHVEATPAERRGARIRSSPGSSLAGVVEQPDELPEELAHVAPTYPLPMRYLGIEGKVRVGFVVEPDGTITNVFVMPGGNAGFAEAAVAAVMQSTYRAAHKNGKPVRCLMAMPVVFVLEGAQGKK